MDIILSCPADFQHRLRLNRAAHQAGIPFIDAAQWGMAGSLLVSDGKNDAMSRLRLSGRAAVRAHFPVVGAIAGTMGNLAALEAIKILSGAGRPLWGRMLLVDGFRGETRQSNSSTELAARLVAGAGVRRIEVQVVRTSRANHSCRNWPLRTMQAWRVPRSCRSKLKRWWTRP